MHNETDTYCAYFHGYFTYLQCLLMQSILCIPCVLAVWYGELSRPSDWIRTYSCIQAPPPLPNQEWEFGLRPSLPSVHPTNRPFLSYRDWSLDSLSLALKCPLPPLLLGTPSDEDKFDTLVTAREEIKEGVSRVKPKSGLHVTLTGHVTIWLEGTLLH